MNPQSFLGNSNENKPSRDWQKIGLSRRRIIELQKQCRKGKHDFKENVKEKLRRFQN